MRLGLLGPANGDVAALRRARDYVVARADRAVYLANDTSFAALEEDAWGRAAHLALDGAAAEIDRFVEDERARLRLRALTELRVTERLGDRTAVLVHDKSDLREEDILASSLLFFGRNEAALVRRIGPRWFVCPGPLGRKGNGVAIFELDDGAVVVTISDAEGTVAQREVLEQG